MAVWKKASIFASIITLVAWCGVGIATVLDRDLLSFVASTVGPLAHFTIRQKLIVVVLFGKAVCIQWAVLFLIYLSIDKLFSLVHFRLWRWLGALLVIGVILWRGLLLEPFLFRPWYQLGWARGIIDALLAIDIKPLLDTVLIGMGVAFVIAWLRKQAWVFGVVVVLVGGLLHISSFSNPQVPANTTVVLLVDSLRKDAIEHNPNSFLAELAGKSVVLENVFTPNPASVPAAAGMLSTKHPAEAEGTFIFLNKQLDTQYIENLRTSHDVYFITDYALDEVVNRQYFNVPFTKAFAPHIDTHNHVVSYALQRNQLLLSFILPVIRPTVLPEYYQSDISNADHVLQQTLDVLGQYRKKPKVVFVALSQLHIPLQAKYPYYRTNVDAKEPRFKWDWTYADYTYQGDNPAVNRNIQQLYAQSLEKLNDDLGDFFKTLEQRGLSANTTVVVTADHGESLFDDNLPRYSHNNIASRHVLNVPFIIYTRDGAAARDSNVYSLVDAFPIALAPEKRADYQREFVYIENDIDFQNLNSDLWDVYGLHSYQEMQINDYDTWQQAKKRAIVADGYVLTYEPEKPDSYALYKLDGDVNFEHNLINQLPGQADKMQKILQEQTAHYLRK